MAFDVARVRGLYPALGDGWVHFDPHAGMQIPDSVATTVAKAFRGLVSRPGGVYPAAQHAAEVVASAREAVADLVNCQPAGVVLGPSSGFLISTLAASMTTRMALGKEIIVSRLDDEHNIVPWLRAADRYGAVVRWVEADIETSQLPTWQFDELVGQNTSVITLTLASSVTGIMTPLREAAEAIHRVGGILVVDATNAAPYTLLDIEAMNADIVIVSADRWGGPRYSAMAFRDPTELSRLRVMSFDAKAVGPERLEIGVHQHALLAGLTASVNHLAGLDDSAIGTRRQQLAVSLDNLFDYHQRLVAYTLQALDQLDLVRVVGSSPVRIPTFSFTVRGISADNVVRRLADNGLAALANQPSKLLDAIGISDDGGAVTIGFGPYSTPYEVDHLVRVLGSLG